MPTLFKERKRAFEQRFAHEEDVRFHVRSRRNRLMAAWACERMGLTGTLAEKYISGFCDAAVVASDEDLIGRFRADLAMAGIEETLPGLRTRLERCAATARAERRMGETLERAR
ncbi:protein of unknown function DUF1476 [Methylobacterium sp. 4-46]|uniref:DUF1476 domain-containing protein n=1 Tax=unclassified Methylobacterium TaxID=2615210 RepID=UPI000152D295|nr:MULTISPECIES: DUF1476 domain-containing protein [Methylobacterium]ACA17292.1 protein of unknown function DUF1476 [Methylobacterium sp. 4-46]WFT82979.1 DUF1476 domain-containing protein [Methylobacterium nodulans]